MAGFGLHFPDFAGAQIRPNNPIKIRLPGGSADEEIAVLADVIPVSVLGFFQRDFLDGLTRDLGIKLAQIMTIAGSPDESIGSKSLVAPGSCPLCDLSRHRIEHAEVVRPRLGKNNLAVLSYGQPMLAGVLPRRDRNLI